MTSLWGLYTQYTVLKRNPYLTNSCPVFKEKTHSDILKGGARNLVLHFNTFGGLSRDIFKKERSKLMEERDL